MAGELDTTQNLDFGWSDLGLTPATLYGVLRQQQRLQENLPPSRHPDFEDVLFCVVPLVGLREFPYHQVLPSLCRAGFACAVSYPEMPDHE